MNPTSFLIGRWKVEERELMIKPPFYVPLSDIIIDSRI